MSKYNNVNPGQYKMAGRERPDTLAQERLKMVKPPRAKRKSAAHTPPAAARKRP